MYTIHRLQLLGDIGYPSCQRWCINGVFVFARYTWETRRKVDTLVEKKRLGFFFVFFLLSRLGVICKR